MDLLGFHPAGRLCSDEFDSRFRVYVRLGGNVCQLQSTLRLRCTGLCGAFFLLRARLLRAPPFALRQCLDRLLPGEGPVSVLLVPGEWRGNGLQ